jgi:AcrR family transcriptional regulator
VTSAGPGRPRKQQPVRPGATARDEILDAAAELFTSQGFANTSTRAVAEAVGIRQSSLYHHFPTKDDILGELLNGTVAGGLAFARAVSRTGRQGAGAGEASEPEGLRAAAKLHAVALYDGTQLCTARWNLGVLYHIPEVRTEKFEPFLNDRRELRQLYRELGRRIEKQAGDAKNTEAARLGDLAFRLVESLINLRADGLLEPQSASQTADSCIVLAGLSTHLQVIRSRSARLIADAPPIPMPSS